ncbi:MAG: UDP-3-O-acyl-N-acetylglucosamine deacetylase [bacterium]
MNFQRTLNKSVSLAGKGLHKGQNVKVTFHSAPAGNGITIRNNKEEYKLSLDLVFDTQRGTSIRYGKSEIYTVEHMLSALRGMGIDNAVIELEGNEPPIFDGSALEYVKALKKAGIKVLEKKRKQLLLKKTIVLKYNGKYIAAIPFAGYRINFFTDFSGKGLLPEECFFEMKGNSFEKEIAPARTFGFKEELDELIKNGLIKGADLRSAILFDKAKPVNTKLRFKNEVTRHKVLDLLGDFGFLEGELNFIVIAVKTGHTQNIEMAKKIIQEAYYVA